MGKFRFFCESTDGKVLIIMRGVPGSGKSFKARQLKGDSGAIFSTDDFWGTDPETYRANWNKAQEEGSVGQKLGQYHGENLKRAIEAMDQGVSPIIIDNTNIRLDHFKPYVDAAMQRGYSVRYEESDHPEWRRYRGGKLHPRPAAKFFAQNNSHGVPEESIGRMLSQWQELPKGHTPTPGGSLRDRIRNRTQNESSLRDLLQPVPQSPKWHKEGDVFSHTKLVRDGLDVAIGLIRDAIHSPQFSAFSDLDPNFTEEDRKLLRAGAWLHDVGKSSATTIDKDRWKPGMAAPPDAKIQAIGHEHPRHFVKQGQTLGSPWQTMFQNAQTGDKRDLAFMITHHMSLRNGTFSKRVAKLILNPTTGKYINDRKVKLLLTLILMDQMGRYGTGEPQFGLANGIEALRQMQNTSDQILAQQKPARTAKPSFDNPDTFRQFLQSKGLSDQAIEASVKKKFGME